ncbi:Holliday junction branch migration protein RuvA [Ruminococcus sp. 210702-SL.1.03]|jgi:Holliday junction DNA helicase RuvA|uniref:Holliday junction branch migration protein RuvA n=1 Tax=Ruminococcus sp. 210702-SL.1.03 TaxID=2883233 RepID=UPI001D0994DA|nr:Holliday junction branch migration protein RuvA [Ruminococcus sp. 210702-SL.1.03]MCB6615172.1 Holliday junction branch migration protein RuvA [Ruminococcus sp. 210702-SL.1.03]
MIYSVSGKLIHTEPELAVVECGGVGYGCKTTFNTLQKIAGESEVMLYTYLSVREDAAELYGFADREELKCFRLLISVSGVGPKAALSILSGMNTQQFALCVATADSKALTKVKGIGAKTAQRIILELKDKLAGETISVRGQSAQPAAVSAAGSNIAEAVTALEVLGYTEGEALSVLSKLDPALPVEELIKKSLIGLAKF